MTQDSADPLQILLSFDERADGVPNVSTGSLMDGRHVHGIQPCMTWSSGQQALKTMRQQVFSNRLASTTTPRI